MLLLLACKSPAAKTLGVTSDDFGPATKSAMQLWNGYVGCDFLVPGDDVTVKSDDGEPCGINVRPDNQWWHAAAAYKCGDKFEILISHPGEIHTQLCIIAHELGHVLGREHARDGVMSRGCPSRVRINDDDTSAVRLAFCK